MHSKTHLYKLKTCRTTPHIVYDTYICSNCMKICMRMINMNLGWYLPREEGKKNEIHAGNTELQLYLKYFIHFKKNRSKGRQSLSF